eukprot:6175754-Pleurochrysis_carterae.AAC.2
MHVRAETDGLRLARPPALASSPQNKRVPNCAEYIDCLRFRRVKRGVQEGRGDQWATRLRGLDGELEQGGVGARLGRECMRDVDLALARKRRRRDEVELLACGAERGGEWLSECVSEYVRE